MRILLYQFILVFALTLSSAGSSLSAQNPQDAVQSSIRELSLQSDMPADVIAPPDRYSSLFHISNEMVRIILWGAVLFGAGVLFYSLRDDLPLWDRSRKLLAAEEGAHKTSTKIAMEEAQLQADDLARAGRYAEAMHVLLLQSLREMRRQLKTTFSDSLTSREILRLVQLSDLGRNAFSKMIQGVEYTHFGNQDAGPADYETCCNYYQILTQALNGEQAQ